MLRFKMASLHFILKKYFTLIKYNKKQNPPPPQIYLAPTSWKLDGSSLIITVFPSLLPITD